MSNVRSAVTKALSDYSEACIGHWKIDGYGSDTDGSGVYWLEDSSPRNNALEFVTAPSAGFNSTSGRGTFNGTSDAVEDVINALSGELQLGKDVDPAHAGAPVLPSIIVAFNIKTTSSAKYPISIRGTSTEAEGVSFQITSGGNASIVWTAIDASSSSVASSPTIVNDGNDHHVCAIIDRANNRANIFISAVSEYSAGINSTFKKAADMVGGGNAAFRFGLLGSTYFPGQLWDVQCYRTYKDFPAGSDAGVALRQSWADKLRAGNHLTKSDL